MRWRRRRMGAASAVALAGTLMAGALAPIAAAGATDSTPAAATVAATGVPGAGGRLIVRLSGSTDADPGLAAALREVVTRAGGRTVALQPALDMAIVDGPA